MYFPYFSFYVSFSGSRMIMSKSILERGLSLSEMDCIMCCLMFYIRSILMDIFKKLSNLLLFMLANLVALKYVKKRYFPP